jgi:hypothetical protein
MTWIRDQNERLVNIDLWDFLDYQTIEDTEKNKICLIKIYLCDREDNEHVLGYLNINRLNDNEELVKQISLGFQPYFNTYATALYDYLDKEFDDGMGCDNFHEKYDERYMKISKLIGKRFKESE